IYAQVVYHTSVGEWGEESAGEDEFGGAQSTADDDTRRVSDGFVYEDGPGGRQADGRDGAILHSCFLNCLVHRCERDPRPDLTACSSVNVCTGGAEHDERCVPPILRLEHDAVSGLLHADAVMLAKCRGVRERRVNLGDPHITRPGELAKRPRQRDLQQLWAFERGSNSK